jgi:hypothetical protein
MSSTNGEVISLSPTSEPAPPPPGGTLLAAIEGMRPVRTRVPARSALLLGAVLAAVPVISLLAFGHRKDLSALPVWWVVATTLAWVAGVALALASATLPARGDVLPDTTKARRRTLIVAAALMLMGLGATVDAPGSTVMVEPTFSAFIEAWRRCFTFALIATLPALVAGGMLLRRLFPVGGRWAAAALGAAGGASAGLTLHLICPIGGGLHAGFAHAGGVAGGALLAAILLSRVLRS